MITEKKDRQTFPECLVIGDLNIDIIMCGLKVLPDLGTEILAQNYNLVVGGSGGIFSSILSSLGIRTGIISKIGNDYFGHHLIECLKKSGTYTDDIIISKDSVTGLTINLSYEQDKSQITSIETVKKLSFSEISLKKIEQIKHIHFSSYYIMQNLKKDYAQFIKKIKSLSKNITFSFDTNYDPEEKWDSEIFDILPLVDILFLNENEALNISKQTDRKRAAYKLAETVPKVIIKLGKEGQLAIIDGKEYRFRCNNTLNDNFIDGTGAGDNFDAGFIFCFLKDFPIEKTMEFANYCAEKSIEYIGGVGEESKFNDIREKYDIVKQKERL